MKTRSMLLLTLGITALGLLGSGCSDEATGPTAPAADAAQSLAEAKNRPGAHRIVVANRASGTISVIDAGTNQVVETIDLPADPGGPSPEPMYVVAARGRVFVGDRANDRVAVFDANTYEVEGTVPAGSGVFHMWADRQGRQLWVNNDIDNTTTVIDPINLTVIATVATPADLVEMGGKPHDVLVSPKGDYAFVSLVGLPGDNDAVVQFSTTTFTETNRVAVGKDPHLSMARQRPWLYVPCQNSDVVLVFDAVSLEPETSIDVPGAHGAGMADNGKFFYTTNLPGGGSGALNTISTRSNTLAAAPVDSPFAVPHNIALANNDKALYVTHSGGAADKVTVYRMIGADPAPQFVTEITVGLNPFGLAYVK